MCRSCLQCWVSDQDWRIRTFCFLDGPGSSAMDSKSSGNTFWLDLLEARGHGPGTPSSGWDKRAEERKHRERRISSLRHRRRLAWELDKRWQKTAEQWTGNPDFNMANTERAPVQFLKRKFNSRARSQKVLGKSGSASGGQDGALSRLSRNRVFTASLVLGLSGGISGRVEEIHLVHHHLGEQLSDAQSCCAEELGKPRRASGQNLSRATYFYGDCSAPCQAVL